MTIPYRNHSLSQNLHQGNHQNHLQREPNNVDLRTQKSPNEQQICDIGRPCVTAASESKSPSNVTRSHGVLYSDVPLTEGNPTISEDVHSPVVVTSQADVANTSSSQDANTSQGFDSAAFDTHENVQVS